MTDTPHGPVEVIRMQRRGWDCHHCDAEDLDDAEVTWEEIADDEGRVIGYQSVCLDCARREEIP